MRRRAPLRPTVRRRLALGAITDDPQQIYAVALAELKSASAVSAAHGDTLGMRQAAEKAHLALSSAVERALGKPIGSSTEEKDALATLGKRDASLAGDFGKLRRALHSDCFHQNKCGAPSDLFVVFGRTEAMLARLQVAARRKHRK
jgi:hypothetical protein